MSAILSFGFFFIDLFCWVISILYLKNKQVFSYKKTLSLLLDQLKIYLFSHIAHIHCSTIFWLEIFD